MLYNYESGANKHCAATPLDSIAKRRKHEVAISQPSELPSTPNGLHELSKAYINPEMTICDGSLEDTDTLIGDMSMDQNNGWLGTRLHDPINYRVSSNDERFIYNYGEINPTSEIEMPPLIIPNPTPLAPSTYYPVCDQLPFEGNRTELLGISTTEGR